MLTANLVHIFITYLIVLQQVLAESEQMRREADDIGPRAELEHWKKRMSKFNYLVDQIKGPEVKAVLGILHTAKSKLIKVRPHPFQKYRPFTLCHVMIVVIWVLWVFFPPRFKRLGAPLKKAVQN